MPKHILMLLKRWIKLDPRYATLLHFFAYIYMYLIKLTVMSNVTVYKV